MAFLHVGLASDCLNLRNSGFIVANGVPRSACFRTHAHVGWRRNRSHHMMPDRVVLKTITPSMSSEQSKVNGGKRSGSIVEGKVYVVGDNIDTDQIIPAEYLTLVPSNPDEYAKLGSFAMCGLPADQYAQRYVDNGEMKSEFRIIVAGNNFGCGSSREHAPVAIGAAGGVAVIAQSYARIFFRNCSATGELYPWESKSRLIEHFKTGQTAQINFDDLTVTNISTGKSFPLKPLGDVLPVIDAGGIFEYARSTGMISSRT